MAKKIVRIFLIVIASIILLNIILFIVFSIPSVQKRAADFALEKLKPKLGTEASLKGIRIRLFNTVELNGLYVEDQRQDTLLYAEKLAVRINAADLLNNSVTLHKVALEDFVANVYRENPDAPFSFQFIIEAFAKAPDTTKVKKDSPPWRITINDLALKNGDLRYNILSEPMTLGQFNPNRMHARDFNFKGEMDFLDVRDMRFGVSKLSLREQNAGIVIGDFDGKVKAKGTQLTSNRVHITVNRSDFLVTNALYDTQTKEFALTAESEVIDPRDAAIFSPRFAHLSKPFSFDVDAAGQLPKVELTRIKLVYGADTRFEISGLMADYSQFERSDVNVNVRNTTVSQDDLEALIRIAAPEYTSPPQLTALGNMELQLQASGKISNFNYDGLIRTEQGDVTATGTGKMTNQFKSLIFEGPVTATDIQLANIIGEGSGVNDATLHAHARVDIVADGDITVTADGSIVSALYKGHRYQNIHMDGVYRGENVSANVRMDSPLNTFDLFADVTFGSEMKFIVNGTVDKLDLKPFIIREGWKNPSLTARIDGNLAGSSIDNLVGTLVVDSTSLSDSTFIYNPGAIYLQASADEGAGKKLQLYSSFLEAEVSGDYYFTTVGNEFMHALHAHLPSLIAEPPRQTRQEAGKNKFDFNLQLKNTEDVSYAFALPFYNVEPATINGSVDMADGEAISLNGYIPRLMVGSNDIRETKIDLSGGTSSGMKLNANTYLAQDNGYINARLNTTAAADSLMNNLAFDIKNNVAQSNGQLQIAMGFLRDAADDMGADIRMLPATVLFNGKNIDFNPAAITYRKDSIRITNFGMREHDMLLLGIEGVASKNPTDNVHIYFNNTELETILAAFNLQNYKGSINGGVYIHQALLNPVLQTENLRIENISIYNDTIGTLRINGDWDNTNKGLNLDAYLANNIQRSLQIKGFLPTGEDSPRAMDVSLRIQDFALNSIQPLATGVFSELAGSLNSDIRVTGKTSEPVMQGWLGIDEGLFKVAFTNVTYKVSDTIRVESGNIGTNNLLITDDNGNTAALSVAVSHSNFGRLVYNATVRMNDFMLLNNEARTDLMAYGQLKLTGDINVTGTPAGIFGEANLTSASRSNVTVVIPQTATAEEYSGVVYINTPEQADSLSFLRRKDGKDTQTTATSSTAIPLNFRAMIDMTPMLQVGVVINPTTGDAIDVNGNGDLAVIFNSRATPTVRVIGDYVIESGKFKYNVVSLRTVDFDIRQGSTLTMIGDPLNTQFNITAYDRVNTDLSALSSSFRNELSNTRVVVDALLEVRGNLDAMNLSYNIDLPEASNDIRQRVNSLISTDEERIRQFGYLVGMGSFYSTEGSADVGVGTEMFTSMAAGTLSRGLDMLFANVLNDNWQVGTILESTDGTLDNARMGLNLSGRLLNDRLRVTGNFSYGENSALAAQQEFMTDFQATWDINSWLMLRAYNQANNRFYRRAPYTQGIGVVVTKEGETLYDLFRFNLGRKGKNDDE